MSSNWLLPEAKKDRQTITARWTPSSMTLIEGVSVREVLHVPKSGGYLTEIFRAERMDGNGHVDQVFQVVLDPGGVSAWHAHAETVDRLFITAGRMRLALYDSRQDSPTHCLTNEFVFGVIRPALVVIPPRVWHGIQNVGETAAAALNLVDRAYDYEDPDHWRVPSDSAEIPYRFAPG